MIICCANNTSEYGTNIHQVKKIISPNAKTSIAQLQTQYNFVKMIDPLPNNASSYDFRMVIDTTNPSNIIAREKTSYEYAVDAAIERKKYIKHKYEEAFFLGCPINLTTGKTFRIDCNRDSMNDWDRLIFNAQRRIAAGTTQETTVIRDFDNKSHILNINEINEMYDQVVAYYYEGILQKKWVLEGQIDTLLTDTNITANEINAIDWI